MPDSKTQRVLAPFVLAVALTGLSGCAGALDRAQEALAIGDQDEAEVQLRKAMQQGSSKAEAAKLLSVLLAKKGEKIAADEPRQAENMFTEALELDPRNEQARLDLARLLMKRGFMADARELLAYEGCSTCGRLVGMMLHQEAQKALEIGDVGNARLIFQQAFDLGHDPIDALGLASTYLAEDPPDLVKAKAMLEAAAPLVAIGQAEAETKFRQLRQQYLLAAAATRQNQLVVDGFAIRTPALQDEPEFDLRFKIAQEQFRNGDSDPAIESLRSLLEKSGQYLEPTQRQVMGAALVIMYSARAAQHLGKGDPAGAARDIADARKIDGDNNRLKLQQVLAIAANGRVDLAFDTLAKDAAPGKDAEQVKAILYSIQAFQALEAGSIPKAEAALAEAEQLAADLPEVRLARAYVLAESRNDELKTKELQEARKIAGFDYPGARVNQYPGALAYLDRARKRIAEQGVLHPFRGPEFDRRASELEQKIRAFYPYDVEWFSGDGGMIELIAEGGQKDVEYSGPRWLKGTAIASPGKTAEIPVPNLGVVTLQIDGKQVGVIVEAHAHIKIKL
ncbi:MAG TPA: tetratricopeptide repeat protein [Enhygromyxa sp.]|nr:tetratricopeptide repeat protein [Enhygromyxa sp.]